MISCVGQDPPGFQEEAASSEGYTTPHSVGTPHQVQNIEI